MSRGPAPDPVVEAAAAMLRKGQNAQAVAFLSAQKTLSPRAADYLCDAFFQQRDWTNALRVLRANLQAHPTPARQRLEAKILNNMGSYAEALASVRAFLRTAPEDTDALGVAKICCFFLKDEAGAAAYGQQALLQKDRAAGPTPPGVWKARDAAGKVIAYSVFGDRKVYLAGAAINIVLAARHYPGWTVRLYCASQLAPRTLELYRSLGAEVVTADTDYPDVPNYLWRFLVADDPRVGTYLCRDADSRPSAAEAALVGEWLASGLPFHVVRGHVLHDDLMLAGLWGGTGSDTLRMRRLIAAYFKGRPSAKYGKDQVFLGAAVWPRIRHLVHVHDAHYATPGVPSHRPPQGASLGAGFQNEARVLAEAAALGIDVRAF